MMYDWDKSFETVSNREHLSNFEAVTLFSLAPPLDTWNSFTLIYAFCILYVQSENYPFRDICVYFINRILLILSKSRTLKYLYLLSWMWSFCSIHILLSFFYYSETNIRYYHFRFTFHWHQVHSLCCAITSTTLVQGLFSFPRGEAHAH